MQLLVIIVVCCYNQFLKSIIYRFYLGWQTLKIVLFALLGVVLACVAALIAFFVIRFVELNTKKPLSFVFIYLSAQRARKQMSKGPNKIILLPDDLMFVIPRGTVFTSRVCFVFLH